LITKEKNKATKALVQLITDPNKEIFEIIKPKILSVGAEAVPFLRELSRKSSDFVSERAEELIKEVHQKNVENLLRDWNNRKEQGVLYAAYLVALFQYPDIKFNEVSAVIDKLEEQVLSEINSHLTPLQKTRAINHIMFDINGFTMNRVNMLSPKNSFIHKTTKNRTGNHISISIVYLALAQKLGMPVYPVGLPQNQILAYINDSKGLTPKNNVLFYINPFNKGVIFGKNEISSFLRSAKKNENPKYYQVCSSAFIIEKLISELIESYKNLGNEEAEEGYSKLLTIF